METIISACVSAGAAIVVCVISGAFQTKKSRDLIQFRLDQLEKKVTAHNNLIERTYELEKHNEVQDEKIKVANNRLKNLEREGQHEKNAR